MQIGIQKHLRALEALCSQVSQGLKSEDRNQPVEFMEISNASNFGNIYPGILRNGVYMTRTIGASEMNDS